MARRPWADFLLLSLDEAGSSPLAPAVQAGAWQERPVGHPAVGTRAPGGVGKEDERATQPYPNVPGELPQAAPDRGLQLLCWTAGRVGRRIHHPTDRE
jgi:hypothetical protein